MVHIVALMVSAALGAMATTSFDLPNQTFAWLVLWPAYTGITYLCIGVGYVMVSGMKGDRHEDDG